ncbi:hypothetical protein Bca101_055801 [Brassica carinata]
MLSSGNEPLVHHFNKNDEISYEEVSFKIPDEEVTKLPFVKQLPRSVTWVFTDSNQLMAANESVVGKKQYHYVDGEAVELSPDKKKYEEAMKQKMEFSKEVDRFIWKIGQKYRLDDLVVQRTLSKFLELKVSDILERYIKLKNDGDISKISDRSKFTSVPATADKHFCRRCLIFDCHLHEEYQPLPRENKSILYEREDAEKQCSKHCYLKLRTAIEADHVMDNDKSISNNKGKNMVSEMSQAHNEWSSVDKNLYLQGVEVFGRNSRECDPDICSSCSLSCGDGSLGEASQPIQCKNMQFLLKKHKKILLAMSGVHGWGAFARHSLKKNEFLGEYTGELVSHEEAEERGRAETKNGFSYLFTLNDKICIDARRKGNKLRFLNHASTNANCYAKLMVVRGDHRIGLFANKNIGEGEELFFNYCYGPGHADWSQ